MSAPAAMTWWPPPSAGDIVWGHFTSGPVPNVKPRPCLVIDVREFAPAQYDVRVAYGTSQRVTALHMGEFAIIRSRHPAAFRLAGLSYDTKFDLGQLLWLPFSSDWFDVPPHAPYGQNPQMGVLHPSLLQAAAAAYQAVSSP